MSLRAMHESRRSNQSNSEPVILPENLIERLAEAQKALEREQERRVQAEQKANSEAEKNKTLQRLLTELSETSDSEMPKKLQEQLNEQGKQLSNEQKLNRQLRKQLQDAENTAEDDKKASDRRISQLEADISDLERKLKYNKFDKEQYLKGLESREQALKDGQEALKTDKAEFNNRVQSKAQEIEQDTISDYETRKAKCEAEQARLIEQQQAVEAERQEWLSSEKEKIDIEVNKRITEHKAKLDEQFAKERDNISNYLTSRDSELTAKFASISGITIIGGLISAVVAVCSVIIAFVHGLLPFLIEDGKEIGGWFSSNWHSIFQSFTFPQSLLSILQLALPLIFLIVVGIWTALDFDERKWVVFADKVSIIFIGTGIGISAVFGKQLSELGSNTVMFPIAVYLLYVLFRWLWEIEAIQALFEGIKWLVSTPIDWWRGLQTNEKGGYAIIGLVIIGAVFMVRHWLKG